MNVNNTESTHSNVSKTHMIKHNIPKPQYHIVSVPTSSIAVQTPKPPSTSTLDTLYDNVIRLGARKLATTITTGVKSGFGNVNELSVTLLCKKCNSDSGYKLLDVSLFITHPTSVINRFTTMVDFRLSRLIPPCTRMASTDHYNTDTFTSIDGRRFSVVGTVDIKSHMGHMTFCDNLYDFLGDVDNTEAVLRKTFTSNMMHEYIMTGVCIQCSDVYISSDKEIDSDDEGGEDNHLCQKCESNYLISKAMGKLDATIPDECCVCGLKQFPFNVSSICTNPAHSIHRTCIIKMSENTLHTCPICRGVRLNNEMYDSDDE